MRLVAEHFKSNGQAKRIYESPEEARDFLRQTNQYQAQYVYQCKFCGKWHTASGTKNTKKRKRSKGKYHRLIGDTWS